MHSLKVPFLSFTNNTDAHQGETLVLIYFLSINYCSCVFNSTNYGVLILYGALDTEDALSTRWIVKSISLFSGNLLFHLEIHSHTLATIHNTLALGLCPLMRLLCTKYQNNIKTSE